MGATSRRIAAPTLAILTAVLLLVATLVGYANSALFDSNEFANRASAALDDEAVRAEIATRVTDDLVINARADLIAVRPVIESVVDGLVGGKVFQSVFRSAVRDVHRAVFRQDQNTVTLTLADVGEVLRGAIQALRPQIAKEIPGKADVEITDVDPPAWVADLARAADNAVAVEIVLLLLAAAMITVALWLSPDKRRTALTFGVAIVVAGVVAVVALGVAKTLVLARIDAAGVRDAVDGIWNAFLGDLTRTLYLFAACGGVIAAAASSLLRPVDLAAPLRKCLELFATTPERRGWRLFRAIALITVGVLIVARSDAFVDLVVLLIGVYVAYAGVAELMRMILPADEEEVRADRVAGGRVLAATAIALVVIVVGSAIFVGAGGLDETRRVLRTEGCNGSRDLCDRPLDEVAFASTHNAMSAATNPGWLFAQQEKGLSAQLNDGIRGLFIDAHFGAPTENGTVKTDLSDLSGPERQAYEEELGPEALDAALRIRDRIVNSPATGPRQVYLCHRFCELGALPLTTAFTEIRDFLAANPSQVVVIVVEDYVPPSEIASAAEKTGLIDHIYTGPLAEPLPSLHQIVRSGGSAVMMSENNDGGQAVPWYHRAYDSLLQETPYSFKRPPELLDRDQLPASCAENRGPRSAPLFLVNHWIDTSPAPKPSNAAKVNTREALLRRVHTCERRRGLLANFLSVDFYLEGDVFGAIDELNAERAAPNP